jgi:hypothetical protein
MSHKFPVDSGDTSRLNFAHSGVRSKRRLYRETLEWKLGELAERSLPAHPADPSDLIEQVIEARERSASDAADLVWSALSVS